MDEIKGIARVRLRPGKLDEWKRLTEQAMEIVRTRVGGLDASGGRAEATRCVYRSMPSGRPISLGQSDSGSSLAVEEGVEQVEQLVWPPGHAHVRGPGKHCELALREEVKHLHDVGQG